MLTAKGTAAPTPAEQREQHEQALKKACVSLLHQFEQQRDVLTLALLLSMSVKVTPALLRDVRLNVCPRFSVETEARLWTSGLVQSANRAGFSFYSWTGQALRRLAAMSLRGEALGTIPASAPLVTGEDLDRAWKLVERHHAAMPGVHQLQAELQWLALQAQVGDPNAVQRQEVLLGQLATSVTQDETSAIRWGIHALPTLEPELRQLPTGWLASMAVKSRVEGAATRRLLVPTGLTPSTLALLPAVLPKEMDRTPIVVRQEAQALVIERARDGLDGIALTAPVTTPLFVRVGWTAAGRDEMRWLELPETGALRWPLPEAVTTLTLHNGWGEGVVLGVVGEGKVEEADVSLQYSVRPSDTVLVINFHEQLVPPKGLSDFDDLACGPAGVLRVNEPETGRGLRDTHIDVSAWEIAMAGTYRVLEELKHRPQGRVHVYFNGPHPLALWLGHQLDIVARQRQILIYQFGVQQRDWIPFLDMSSASSGKPSRVLATALIVGGLIPDGIGTVLALEIIQHSQPSQLEALRARVGAKEIRRIQSLAPGTAMSAGKEALDALDYIVSELNEIRTHAQKEPIYLATSAPVALIIGLGKRIPKSAFPQVWGCYFEAEQAQYLAVLEIIRPQIAQALRPRLEIIGKPHGLLYRLNGELLEAAGSNLKGVDPIVDRRTQNFAPLHEGIQKLSRAILPEEVEREIAILPRLDIELKLTGPAADLSWELLSLGRGGFWDDPVALKAGWTLTRLCTPSRPVREQPLLNQGQLRVMIVPSLDTNAPRFSAEQAEADLKLKDLSAWMAAQEVSILRLDYGVTLAELEQTLRTFKPHILHWIGHGLPDAGAGTPDVLEVSDWDGLRTLDRTRLPEFIHLAGPDLRLVVLQACSARRPSNGYGVPSLLIERGLGAAIGFRDQTGGHELRRFNHAFYAVLLRGESIRDALTEARSAIHGDHSYHASFASPILCAASPRAVGPLVKVPQWRVHVERLRGIEDDPRLGLEKPENWIWIPPGEFVMGDEKGHSDEKPAHRVQISSGYYMSRFPVTNHDFSAFVEGGGYRQRLWWSEEGWSFCQANKLNAPGFWKDSRWNTPNQPVVGVSWHEASAFCRWMTAKVQSTTPVGQDPFTFRLPSEAEWEFAARGKLGRKYPWGAEEPTPKRANYDETGLGRTSPVGAFPLGATPEGILDMAGNVWEWVKDPYDVDYTGAPIAREPRTKSHQLLRVIRGGGCNDFSSNLRATVRGRDNPDFRDFHVGFRLVRSSTPPVQSIDSGRSTYASSSFPSPRSSFVTNALAAPFDRFLKSIEMRRELIQAITAQLTPLRERLQKRWPGSRLFFSGSYGRSTKIEPISDVDLFMVRPEQYREIGKIPISQEQLLSEVNAEVRMLFPHHTIRLQTRSLGIVLPQFRIDLVPAFSRTGGGYFIPDRSPGTPNWRFTHPDKQLEFTKRVDQATGQMAIPLVKMVKVWNRNRHVGLKSYHVEVMVLRALSGKPLSYAEGLKTVFERLEHAIKRPCGDPGESGGTLDTYLDAHTRARASEEAKRAAAQMTEALGLVTLKREAEAIRLVADLMGPSFPKG